MTIYRLVPTNIFDIPAVLHTHILFTLCVLIIDLNLNPCFSLFFRRRDLVSEWPLYAGTVSFWSYCYFQGNSYRKSHHTCRTPRREYHKVSLIFCYRTGAGNLSLQVSTNFETPALRRNAIGGQNKLKRHLERNYIFGKMFCNVWHYSLLCNKRRGPCTILKGRGEVRRPDVK